VLVLVLVLLVLVLVLLVQVQVLMQTAQKKKKNFLRSLQLLPQLLFLHLGWLALLQATMPLLRHLLLLLMLLLWEVANLLARECQQQRLDLVWKCQATAACCRHFVLAA